MYVYVCMCVCVNVYTCIIDETIGLACMHNLCDYLLNRVVGKPANQSQDS